MSISETARNHSVGFFVGVGALGGIALVVTKLLTTRGPIVFVPYAAFVVLCAAYIRFADVQTFGRRFLLSLYAFTTASAIFYVFIGTIATQGLFRIPLLGHAERISLMLAIGMVISTVIALSGGVAKRA